MTQRIHPIERDSRIWVLKRKIRGNLICVRKTGAIYRAGEGTAIKHMKADDKPTRKHV